MAEKATDDYFRRDQHDGISPPDLSKDCSFAEHIVHARGKRTRFTSVSLDLSRIRDFGKRSYQLIRELIDSDKHLLVEHQELLDELRQVSRHESKAERIRALQAIRYVTRRKEGLVRWSFDVSGISRKDVISWAQQKVQRYFKPVD